jgi:hypothetical protein
VSTTPEGEALLTRQRALEDHMLGEGGKRFRRKVESAIAAGETSTAGAGVKLLKGAIEPLTKGISDMLDSKGKRGPKHLANRWCLAVGADVAAFITARVIIDGMMSTTPLGAGGSADRDTHPR